MRRGIVAQIVGKVAPAAAAAHHIQNRVQHLPVVTPPASMGRLRRQMGLDERPLRIRQVGGVRFSFHTPNLRKTNPPRQVHSKIGSCFATFPAFTANTLALIS